MFFYPSVYFVRLDIFMFRLSGKMDRLFFQDTRWLLLAEAVYILILIGVCVRVVYDTRSVAKTLGYLLLVILFFVRECREAAYSRIRQYLCFRTGSSCSLFYWRNWRKRKSTFIFPVPELVQDGG